MKTNYWLDRNRFLSQLRFGSARTFTNARSPVTTALNGSPRWVGLIVALVLVCFGLSPGARATDTDGIIAGGSNADGYKVLTLQNTGGFNTGTGWFSLYSDVAGSFNTAYGAGSLFSNNGDDNTAVGAATLFHNTSGSQNVAIGTSALGSNTIGGGNTAVGENALVTNTSGINNVAVGNGALYFGNGSQNVALGFLAGSDTGNGGGNIYIGAQMLGSSGDTNQTYIANIGSTNVSGAGTDTVTVNLTTGLIGHLTSSRRYKEEIKPIENASETIYRLRPVTYRYKKMIDPTQSAAFGLIAEEVAEVNPNLVARDAKGQPESVHYEMVNAMLLNEFLKEHRKVEQQDHKIQKQDATIARLEKEIGVLTAGLQKVSAQLEVSKPAPRTVQNDE